jgi:hypothetical protein
MLKEIDEVYAVDAILSGLAHSVERYCIAEERDPRGAGAVNKPCGCRGCRIGRCRQCHIEGTNLTTHCPGKPVADNFFQPGMDYMEGVWYSRDQVLQRRHRARKRGR